MTKQELDFSKYFNKIIIDAMLFEATDAILEELGQSDLEELEKDINLDYLLEVLDEMSYGHYPKHAVNNMGIIINYIKENSNKNIEQLFNKYEQIKDLPTDENVYLYEALNKVLNSTHLKYLDYIKVDETTINDSIRFDSVTIYSLINENMEIQNTILYIYSIKKFLSEFPDMFLDKNINARALEILEKNKHHEGAERLIHKLNHIEKFINNNFDMINYKRLYDYIVLQNMLNNEVIFKQNIQNISEDIMETLYEMIEYKLIKDEENKKKAYEIMHTYKNKVYDSIPQNQKRAYLEKYNKYLGLLNSMTEYSNNMIISEYETRLNGLEKHKYSFKALDIDNLILKDLQIMSLFIFDNEKYLEQINQIDHKEIYMCINKFICLAPTIFDDETIYRRTMELLDDKNIQTLKTKNKVKRIYEGR